jgi:hypothetical protein
LTIEDFFELDRRGQRLILARLREKSERLRKENERLADLLEAGIPWSRVGEAERKARMLLPEGQLVRATEMVEKLGLSSASSVDRLKKRVGISSRKIGKDWYWEKVKAPKNPVRAGAVPKPRTLC